MKTNHRWMLAALCLLASAHSYAQQNMELTQKQQALAAIAAHEAKGDLEALKRSLNEGFQQGLTLSQAKEALSQLYAYTGFPRSLNALGALQQVVSQRAAAGLTTEAGREADPCPPTTTPCSKARRCRRSSRADSPSTTPSPRRPTTI